MMIEREGPVAPWRQLAQLLRDRIRSGELPPGARVPSIDSLRQEYGLAYTTVQKAIAALKDEGLITTSPMGSFVTRASDLTEPRHLQNDH
jgi:GntR family transcriptional regulator